jgi:hypothetical protein
MQQTFITIEEDARRTSKKRNPGKGKPKPQGGGGNTDDSGSSNTSEKEQKGSVAHPVLQM